MKKKLSLFLFALLLVFITACSSSDKKKGKEAVPVKKEEVKNVVPIATPNEVKPVVNPVKEEKIETAKIPEPKVEEKIVEKVIEKTNIIFIVATKEEASTLINSILANGKIDDKNMINISNNIKQEIYEKPTPKEEKKEEKKDLTPVLTSVPVVETSKIDDKKIPVVEKVENNNIVNTVEEIALTKIDTTIDKKTDTDKDGLPDYFDAFPNEVLKTSLINKGIQKVIISDRMKETDTILTTEMQEELDMIANIMKKDKTLKIKIVAHTNNIGNETVNLKLSEKRALLAKAYLNKKGIPLNYVATAWKGGSEPMVSNDTKENRAKNKRLEVIFYIANVK